MLVVAAVIAAVSPSPSPTPGITVHVQGSNVYVSQNAAGPGLSPPEAGAFEAGLPLSPMSPYDYFSSAPTTPGNAGQLQYLIGVTDRTKTLTLGATFLAGLYGGDTTTLMYWGEPWLGPLDPHEGRSPLAYRIAFPRYAGAGNQGYSGQLVTPYSASLATNDGRWNVRGGYFDLTQSDRFVFAPPAVTNVTPSIGVQTAETLGPGVPNLDAWSPSPSTLPLYGGDAVYAQGASRAEVTDALLPVLQGTQARLVMGSYVLDRGDGGRYSAQIADITTSGNPISTTTYFGANPELFPGPQGTLYGSTLAAQVQTIAGVRAFVHPHRGDDVLAEFGQAWYHSALAAQPGSARPGSYEHLAFTRHFDSRTDAGVEYYRFGPRYATVILPYGVPENVWSAAWSWPGQWLKSNYQAVDNSIVGVNREGYRVHADANRGRLELHADASVWREIDPITLTNAAQEGWVDGFFLPENVADATLGWQRHVGLYVAWHFPHDDLVLDTAWDRAYRPAIDSTDFVSMNEPQIVVSVAHHSGKRLVAAFGYGRYSATGFWSTTPVQGIYGVAFAGAQWDFGHGRQLLMQLRRFGLVGLPSIPGGPQPDERGTALVVDQRIEF
ncbi:MAG TPA: hypothetical protein VIK27_11150 [Candidatus Aquilonibacter sp.]